MSIRTLDRKSALIVIDLQKGIVAANLNFGAAEVVRKSRMLACDFRAHDLPVVWVNVTGQPKVRTEQGGAGPRPADWAELVADTGADHDRDIFVTKNSWGAFTGTDLEEKLRHLGVTQIVLTGLVTSIGVETSARQGYERGFNVAVVRDAVADFSKEAHENSLKRIFPRLGECGSAENVRALLEG